MEREPQLEPPNLLHRDRLDPGLVKAFAASAAVHVIVLVALILAGSAAHQALKPATTYTVGLVDLDSGSALLDLGPLGDQVAPRENVFGAPTAAVSPPAVFAPPAVVKSVEPAPPPKPAPEVEPQPEPPAPKVEAQPPPKPDPPKVEAKKPEIKPEVKPEPKPEAKAPPKPEVKAKPEPKPKPAPKPEVKTTAKAEPKPKPTPKPAEKPAAKSDAKATPAKSASTAAVIKTTDAAAKPGAAATTTAQSGGGATIAKATPPGPGSGGGGGFGGTGPGGGPAGGELRSPEFVSYFEHIKRTIRRGWVWQTADPNIRTTVGFAVLGDGRLANIRSVESSGDPRFDLSVLNAVRAAQGQLGPPPTQYQKDFSDVQIVFRPQDLAE